MNVIRLLANPSPSDLFAVCSHNLTLSVVAKERGSATHGWTQEHKDHEKSETLSPRLLVPLQQSAPGHQTQLQVKTCVLLCVFDQKKKISPF